MTTAMKELRLDTKTLLKANSWKRKYIISSTGTALKNSTTMPQTHRITELWARRPSPSRIPNTSEPTMETAAGLRVLIRPGTTYDVQTSGWTRGDQSSAV